MAGKIFVWKGPQTSIEILSQGEEQSVVFCGQVAPGQRLPALDKSYPLVASWLAFGMIEEAPEEPQPQELAQIEAATSGRRAARTQENIDG